MKNRLILLISLLILSIFSGFSQSTYLSTTSLGGGNGSSAITFNIAASRDINLKDVKCLFSAVAGNSQLYYNPTAINGTPSVTPANGWILLGTINPGASGLQSMAPFSLFMPAGSNFGFCIFSNNIVYTGSGSGAPTFSPTSFTDGVITIDVGTNVGYGGNTHASHVRGFNGEIGYEVVATSGNDAAVTNVFAQLACPSTDTVFTEIANYGKNQIDSVLVNWSKNGVIQSPINYTSLIDTFGGTGANVVTVPLGLNTFLAGVTDTFDVWTTLPNGVLDTVVSNDSNFAYLKPLSGGGTYTIGGTSPDYSTFNAAIASLNSSGICGPVVFNVRQGAYNEQIDVGAIVGLSAVNTILFKPDPANIAPVEITYGASTAADNYVIKIDGAEYITFDSIEITATGSTYGYAVHLKDAEYITIKNCEINASNATSAITSIAVYNEPGLNVEDCTIENNIIKYGRYGLFWQGGSSSSREAGNTIRNNEIKNFNSYGLSSFYQNGLVVEGNVFDQIKSTSSDTWGMFFQYNYSPSISRNKINLTSTGDNIGIYLFNCFGTSSNKLEVYNNMIVTAITTSGSNNGIYIRDGKHINVYHNSVHCRGGNSFDSKAMNIFSLGIGSNFGTTKIRNNIFVNSGQGQAFYIRGSASSAGFVTQQDFNIYKSTTTTPLSIGGTLHTLASWQSTTSFDANSYDYDPGFLSATDLHIQDTTAADKGTNVNVNIDIDGDIRPLLPSTGYDIGADEYIPPTCPFGSGLFTFLPTPVGTDVSWSKGTNDTSWIFEYGLPGFTPGTGTSIFSTNDTATITGLNPVTDYCVYVRGICGSGDTSLYVGPICFRTRCVSSLSGIYTINNTLPTSGTNFNSFGDVMNSLNSCGISGPTTFNVTQGTYNEHIDIGSIVGSSSINTITFQSDPSNVSAAELLYTAGSIASNYVVKFSGADHIIFDDLTINANGTTYGYGFHFVSADYITIKNCKINCVSNNSSRIAPIYNQSGATNSSENCTIENNNLRNGYYGVYWYGNSSAKEIGNVILNNTISDFYIYGVNFNSQKGGRVESNTIQQRPLATSSAYGLNVSQNEEVKIKSNKVTLTASGNNFGLSLNNSVGTSSNKVEVYNNMIVTSANSSSTSNGVYIGKGKHVNFYHNSVNVQGGASSTSRGLFLIGDLGSAYGDVNIRNNIFSNSGLGVAMEIDSGAVSSFLDDMDNNIYHAVSGTLINFESTFHTSLVSYVSASGLDSNSLSGNPGFLSGIDLHSQGAIAYDNGDPTVGLTNDIDGDVRPLTPSSGWDIGADEYIIPSCPSPYSIKTDTVLTTSATISWTNGPADNSWQLQYGTSGFTLGTGTILNSTTNPATIPGINHSTCYDVWLRSICAAGDTSVWIGPFNFCTKCAPTSDFCTDFDSDGLVVTPLCWEILNVTTGTGSISTANNNFRSPGQSVHFQNNSDASALMMLISPEISNLTAGTHRANFWAKGDSTIIIGTMDDPTNPGSFNVWDTLQNPNSLLYVNYKVDFSTYVGTDKYVAIWWVPGTTNDNLYVDDFCWEFAPSCERPPSVSVLNSGFRDTSINIGWNTDSTHVSYIINYGPFGYDPVTNPAGGLTITSLSNFVTVGGLSPTTEYCFWVRAVCTNGDTSFWNGPHCGETGCPDEVPPPYFNDFSNYKFVSGVGEQLPLCWTEGKGVLTNSTTLSMGASSWIYDGFANSGTDGSARINIEGTNKNEWFVSPVFDLGSDPNKFWYIEFDIAMTDFANTAAGTIGADDSLAFLISTNGGATWDKANILELWDQSRVPSNSVDHIGYLLKYATGNVQFAFYATSSVSNEDNDWFIDNFRIDHLPLGTEEVSFNNNFKVFPNPNNGVFTIMNKGVAHKSSVKLLDIQGRLVYERKFFFTKNGRNQIEVNRLNSGVYILLLQSDGKLEQHRIVIE